MAFRCSVKENIMLKPDFKKYGKKEFTPEELWGAILQFLPADKCNAFAVVNKFSNTLLFSQRPYIATICNLTKNRQEVLHLNEKNLQGVTLHYQYDNYWTEFYHKVEDQVIIKELNKKSQLQLPQFPEVPPTHERKSPRLAKTKRYLPALRNI